MLITTAEAKRSRESHEQDNQQSIGNQRIRENSKRRGIRNRNVIPLQTSKTRDVRESVLLSEECAREWGGGGGVHGMCDRMSCCPGTRLAVFTLVSCNIPISRSGTSASMKSLGGRQLLVSIAPGLPNVPNRKKRCG